MEREELLEKLQHLNELYDQRDRLDQEIESLRTAIIEDANPDLFQKSYELNSGKRIRLTYRRSIAFDDQKVRDLMGSDYYAASNLDSKKLNSQYKEQAYSALKVAGILDDVLSTDRKNFETWCYKNSKEGALESVATVEFKPVIWRQSK